MKLGELKSAIRGCKDVRVTVSTPSGPMQVRAMKSHLIESLSEVYGTKKSVETRITLERDGERGLLVEEAVATGPAVVVGALAEMADSVDALFDDLNSDDVFG